MLFIYVHIRSQRTYFQYLEGIECKYPNDRVKRLSDDLVDVMNETSLSATLAVSEDKSGPTPAVSPMPSAAGPQYNMYADQTDCYRYSDADNILSDDEKMAEILILMH